MPEPQGLSPVDKDACEAMQREEREVLEVRRSAFRMVYTPGFKRMKSIFPDFLSNGWDTVEGRIELDIPVELTEEPPRKVMILPPDEQPKRDPSHVSCNFQSPLPLTTLPSITLLLTLPLGYPLYRPPIISGLRSSYGWLTAEKLKLLERALLSVWEVEWQEGGGEGRAILYDWIEIVRTAECCLEKLGMIRDGNIL